ncbi:AAA family ATPase [Parachitinimonas caeni]|uniref:AAA family ATPase n=1 Tax=Parachitinimonas caeni TaxID=3031301 RepID=A0ABT7DX88_9NEIS|nr:AAA family ATPase [Parachitinimonas caeni]MDK2123698.1 AAA family ATPase [Parachitinimonas caeni]
MNTSRREALTFELKHIGCIKAGRFTVKPLTLLCGPNNSGKTWAMYSLYGFLSQSGDIAASPRSLERLGLSEFVEQVTNQGIAELDLKSWFDSYFDALKSASNKYSASRLPDIFRADSGIFARSEFNWDSDKTALIDSAIQRPLRGALKLGKDSKEFLRVEKEANSPMLKLIVLDPEFPDVGRFILDFILRHLLEGTKLHQPFLLPAERNGLHLFFRELSNRRTALLHHASKEKIDLQSLMQDIIRSRYAEPIADYIDWLNDLTSAKKRKDGPFHALAEDLKKQLVGGRYEVDPLGNISFTPRKQGRGKEAEAPPKLDLHLTSSTVKSLFGLWFYLEHQAEKGHVLMIDEPELNLHPANQRAIARILARLVNAGLNMVISTHSDYLVRELNALIMLSREHPERERLMKLGNYQADELLSPDQVGAYLFDNNTISPMHVEQDEGVIAETFDEEIVKLNDIGNEIYYTYADAEAKDEADT